jgi:AcrR family transcriptional regulator
MQAGATHGREVLAEISYEALSINDLCSQASLTKGAFYRRFESKDTFFLALQRLALDDDARVQHAFTTQMDRRGGDPMPVAECLRLVVNDVREWHLRHRGVIRASLQRRDHATDGWRPFKEYGRGFVDEVAARLTRLPELRNDKEALARLKIGFQTAIATMVNAALNDPGPLHLTDTAMTGALARMLTLYMLTPEAGCAA